MAAFGYSQTGTVRLPLNGHNAWNENRYRLLKKYNDHCMQKPFIIALFLALSLVTVTQTSCNKTADAKDAEHGVTPAEKTVEPFTAGAEWNDYWYRGLAEITSYTLQQGRYTDVHPGNVVNIFVTEDFSKSKHVKLDDPAAAGADKLPVLKLNQEYKFNTGLYSYSSLISIFQPVDLNNYPHAVKVATSVQDWCGIAFLQLNARGKKNEMQQLSYFESEGDRNFSLDQTVTEDELWTQIRIAPEKLPVGKMQVLPGTIYLRYSHQPIKPYPATLTLTPSESIYTYRIEIPELKKTLAITFEKAFPYTITGWEETYPGFEGKMLTTTAKLNKRIMSDYWNKHNPADRALREELGLPADAQ